VYIELKEQESSSSTKAAAAQKQQSHVDRSVKLNHMLQSESLQQRVKE